MHCKRHTKYTGTRVFCYKRNNFTVCCGLNKYIFQIVGSGKVKASVKFNNATFTAINVIFFQFGSCVGIKYNRQGNQNSNSNPNLDTIYKSAQTMPFELLTAIS